MIGQLLCPDALPVALTDLFGYAMAMAGPKSPKQQSAQSRYAFIEMNSSLYLGKGLMALGA